MKIGFLPLYIALYDRTSPARRVHLQETYEMLAKLIEQQGFEVIRTKLLCVKPEFEEAIKMFEDEGAEAIITWHAAYSPSLESIDAICATKLPVVVMDTTETLVFGNMQDPSMIGPNHGIHGVMDFCSMMKRRNRPYAIAAGHYEASDVVERACGFVKAYLAAEALKGMKVGLVGGAFEGMGDFTVDYNELKEKYGIDVEQMDIKRMAEIYDSLTDEEVKAEIEENEKNFDFAENVIPEEYELNVRSCVALRKYIKEKNYGAFSVNFTQLGRATSGLTSMPFLEACKEMANGIGYAGEGDALTAAFTGAFIKSWPNTSFVEIFCPDWVNSMVLLSHMGEVNYRLADFKPVITRNGTNFTPGAMPYAGYTRMTGAKGVYVNVSRGADDYQITCAQAEIVKYDDDAFQGEIRGWMKINNMSTANFLEKLSFNGATHHSTFVVGATTEQIEYFGKLLNIPTVVIK